MFAANSYLPNGEMFDFWDDETEYVSEIHVDVQCPDASDENDGCADRPLLSISRAAALARPGTKVLVHPGVYRETVAPAIGGSGKASMICFEAVGEEGCVLISGSEIARNITPSAGWRRTGDAGIWTAFLNPEQFKGYNPFCANNLIHSRKWLDLTRENRTAHLNRRGVVFIDGQMLHQVEQYRYMEDEPGTYWVESNGMTVHFRPFTDIDPREHLVELTAREQNFAPSVKGLGYIRVKGFHFTHAATGHPVPQRGSVSTARGHHWIIENNTVEWSNSVGIDIGNETGAATIGEIPPCHTIIRNNDIRSCGVCGVAGNTVWNMLMEDNRVTDCGWLMTWHCSESGGIKFHRAKNCLIRRNIVEKLSCGDAIWLDVENDNNRISQNLVLNNESPDPRIIHIECSRDYPNLIDNNIIWDCRATTPAPIFDALNEREEQSMQGGIMSLGADHLWAIHNLIGKCTIGLNLNAVSFRQGSGRGGTGRDAHVYNNIFYDCRDAAIRFETPENESDGNIFAEMPSGYLRLHFPLPEKLLHLSAWQEFLGFDLNSVTARFDIEIDEEKYELRFLPERLRREDIYKSASSKPARNREAVGAENIPRVASRPSVSSDYFDRERADMTLPGPFDEIDATLSLNIDPRRP